MQRGYLFCRKGKGRSDKLVPETTDTTVLVVARAIPPLWYSTQTDANLDDQWLRSAISTDRGTVELPGKAEESSSRGKSCRGSRVFGRRVPRSREGRGLRLLFFLRRHRNPLPFVGLGIELIDLADVDVVHFGKEFARRNVASLVSGTHVT